MYRASQAGVRIDLICRGICSLRPGMPGVSDNIRVISIVDRFLEHSRIFYFGNDGDPQVYIGSADWMDRNLSRRVEVVFPIEPPELKQRLIREILATSLADNVKARELLADGSYERIKPIGGTGVSPVDDPQRASAVRTVSWRWPLSTRCGRSRKPRRRRSPSWNSVQPRPPPPQATNKLKKELTRESQKTQRRKEER